MLSLVTTDVPTVIVQKIINIPSDTIRRLLNSAGYNIPEDAEVSDAVVEFEPDEYEYNPGPITPAA